MSLARVGNSMTRAVLDTNVFVSALTGGPVSGRLYAKLRREEFSLLVSPDLVEELAFVLGRPDFGVTSAEIDSIIRFLLSHGILVVPSERISVCRDPEDNKVLECAVEGRADFIVSGDKDLLVLHPFRGITITKPREFLSVLETGSAKRGY